MIRRVHSLTTKGDIDVTAGTITVYDKDGNVIGVYKILDLFNEFDGKVVTLNIKEQHEDDSLDSSSDE